MWLTIQIAMWGTALAVVIAVPFGLACARNVSPPWLQQPMRLLMNLLRSIPDLVVGTLFIVAVGLGPFAGVMALAINTGGVLAKLFSEAVESIDKGPVEGVRATGATQLHEVIWGVIPQVGPLVDLLRALPLRIELALGDRAGPDRGGRHRPAAVRDAQRLRLPPPLGHRHRDHRRRDPDRPALATDAQPPALTF